MQHVKAYKFNTVYSHLIKTKNINILETKATQIIMTHIIGKNANKWITDDKQNCNLLFYILILTFINSS